MHPQNITLPFDNERFWAKVDFDGPLPEHHPELGPCWLWTAAVGEWGYGYFGVNRRAVKTHRYSYEMTYGLIPDGLLVCHVCDRPACVNPRHFRLGTNKDNSDDKIGKGRGAFQRHGSTFLEHGPDHWTHRNPGASPVIGKSGEANPAAKFTETDIIAIRRRYAEGDVSQLALAKKYGTEQTVIGGIVRGIQWAHVEDPDAPPPKPRIYASRQGEACGHAKITADDVRAIRARYAAGGIAMKALGREYGVSAATVCLMVQRQTWQNVD